MLINNTNRNFLMDWGRQPNCGIVVVQPHLYVPRNFNNNVYEFQVCHLDQSVRKLFDQQELSCELHEWIQSYEVHAILPFSILEYSRAISTKNLFLNTSRNEGMKLVQKFYRSSDGVTPMEKIILVKNKLEYEFKRRLSVQAIQKGIQKHLDHLPQDAWQARQYAQECFNKTPYLYEHYIIPQLSWDRITCMNWIQELKSSNKPHILHINQLIIGQFLKYRNLYMLRYFDFINSDFKKINLKSILPYVMSPCLVSKKISLKFINQGDTALRQRADLGDVELIHTAFYGQRSHCGALRQPIDCFTTDSETEVAARIRLYIQAHLMLLAVFPDAFEDILNCCGRIHVLNKQGQKKIKTFCIHSEIESFFKRSIGAGLDAHDFDKICSCIIKGRETK